MTHLADRGDVQGTPKETPESLEVPQPPTRVLLAVYINGKPDAKGLPTFMSRDEMEEDENYLLVEATYKSSSDTTLCLVIAPLAFWQLLPDHEKCQFVSVITGGNLRNDPLRASATSGCSQ